jgi:hypothetical protein
MMQRPGADCGQKQDPGGGMHGERKKVLGEQEGRKRQEGRK